ncbi:MAG: hypothetical protein JOS17DRAFT_786091 [Linnemannia elongata]|nr:MAG: hypothetical protein JOS17DRAFT_786091 [Linnemannia elongata]
MHTTSFESLPAEVQEMVGPFLSQHQLTVCLRVCRAWKRMFNPSLWRDIFIDLLDHEFWWCDIVDALRANSHLIQSLGISTVFPEDRMCYFLGLDLPAFPRLTSIKVYGPCEYGSDQEFARLLDLPSAPAGLKRVVFDTAGYSTFLFDFKLESFNTLACHASTLEVLRIDGMTSLTSEQINELLCCAPRLKELYLFGDNMVTKGNCLNARDVVQSAWVCSNIEVFACRIRNIPRPDITRDIAGWPARDHTTGYDTPQQESVELQRRVYRQLGRLTKLRELTLGFPIDVSDYANSLEDKEYHRQYDCLAMTLESGLDLLKDLKDLRVVGLEEMEVYSDGDKEQDWFTKNWPKTRVSTTDYRDMEASMTSQENTTL